VTQVPVEIVEKFPILVLRVSIVRELTVRNAVDKRVVYKFLIYASSTKIVLASMAFVEMYMEEIWGAIRVQISI
jgi:hypothetical protein